MGGEHIDLTFGSCFMFRSFKTDGYVGELLYYNGENEPFIAGAVSAADITQQERDGINCLEIRIQGCEPVIVPKGSYIIYSCNESQYIRTSPCLSDMSMYRGLDGRTVEEFELIELEGGLIPWQNRQ